MLVSAIYIYFFIHQNITMSTLLVTTVEAEEEATKHYFSMWCDLCRGSVILQTPPPRHYHPGNGIRSHRWRAQPKTHLSPLHFRCQSPSPGYHLSFRRQSSLEGSSWCSRISLHPESPRRRASGMPGILEGQIGVWWQLVNREQSTFLADFSFPEGN